MSNRLAAARRERGWTQARLIHALREAARIHNRELPSSASLKRRIAAWENQDKGISEQYAELLGEVYGKTPFELGLIVETPAPVIELEAIPTFTRLDDGLVGLLHDQTHNIRLLDRRLGGDAIFRQTRAHVDQIESLLRYAMPGTQREAAADALSQAAALAGWQALDNGRVDEAWQLHETAVAAARESGVAAGLGYARAQQAYVLIDAGEHVAAHQLIGAARAEAASSVPNDLAAWLLAAEGEALAHLGDRDGALRVLDAAAEVMPDAPDDELPYVMLDASHLARWRGNCLARLGETSAIDDLTSARLAMGEGQYGRAEVSLRVDLALAFRARGDLTEARLHARRANELAGRTGSQRQHRRIKHLLVA